MFQSVVKNNPKYRNRTVSLLTMIENSVAGGVEREVIADQIAGENQSYFVHIAEKKIERLLIVTVIHQPYLL